MNVKYTVSVLPVNVTFSQVRVQYLILPIRSIMFSTVPTNRNESRLVCVFANPKATPGPNYSTSADYIVYRIKPAMCLQISQCLSTNSKINGTDQGLNLPGSKSLLSNRPSPQRKVTPISAPLRGITTSTYVYTPFRSKGNLAATQNLRRSSSVYQ